MMHGVQEINNFTNCNILQSIEDQSGFMDNNFGPSRSDIENYEAASIEAIKTADLIQLCEMNEMDIEFPNEQFIVQPVPKGDTFPNLTEHDKGGLNFELNLNPPNASKNNWYYSSKLFKVFIKLERNFLIEVEYTPRTSEKLYLRAMMVFIEDVSAPVTRCNNHFYADKTGNEIEKSNIIRCENYSVQYLGRGDGKHLKDRLSLRIPLYCQPGEDNIVKETIALKFVCQNSCIGRRQTAVIFTIETLDSQVLSKKVVNVKICACPKRDKLTDENKYVQRQMVEQAEQKIPPGKCLMQVKEEPESDNSPIKLLEQNEIKEETPVEWPGIQDTDNPMECRFTVEFPNLECSRFFLESAYDLIAGEMLSKPENADALIKYLKELKKLLNK